MAKDKTEWRPCPDCGTAPCVPALDTNDACKFNHAPRSTWYARDLVGIECYSE